MYNKRLITSAPSLALSAIIFAGGALWVENSIRNAQGPEQAFLIASDDGLEFVHNIESALPRDVETHLSEFISGVAPQSLQIGTLNSLELYAEAAPETQRAMRSYVGRVLTSRNQFRDALVFLNSLSQVERQATSSTFAYAEARKGLGETSAALDAYAYHIRANPNHQAGHINYAILLADLDRHEDAIAVLNKTIEITNGKRKGKALALLGISLMELEDYEQAEAAFGRSIEYRPTHGPTWRRLANSRAKTGRFSEEDVISTFLRSDAVAPGSARTKADLANYYFSVGRFDDALEFYRNATKLAPTKASYALVRAVNLIASERPSAARKLLKKLRATKLSRAEEQQVRMIDVLLNGNSAKVLKMLGGANADYDSELDAFLMVLLHLEVGDFEGANEKLSKFGASSNYKSPARFILAKQLYRSERLGEAEALLSDLTTRSAQSPIYWLYLGRTKTAQNAPDDAYDAHKQAYDLYPESGKVTIEYARSLRALGQSQNAIEVLLTYLEEKPKESRALIALADFYDMDGNLERAEQIYKLVHDQQTDSYDTATKLAIVQLRANRVRAALSTLDRVIEQNPSETQVRLLRADALQKLGRYEDAAIEYERVLKLDANNETAKSALVQLAGYLN